MKTYQKVILINFASICAIFALFEVLVRILLPYNAPFSKRYNSSIAYQSSGYVRFFPLANQTIYKVEDSVVQYDKVMFKINRYGYRGNDFPIQKDDEEIRIAILGGSHVFDLNSYDYEGNYGFPRLIQDRFQEEGYNVSVINAGIPGMNIRGFPAHILLDLHRYQLDIVIINSIWNDTKWISRTGVFTQAVRQLPRVERKNPMLEKINWFDQVFGFSALYRKTRDYYWRRVLEKDRGQNTSISEGIIENPDVEVRDVGIGLDQYKKSVVGAVQVIRGIGAMPVIAIEERFVSSRNTDEDKRKIKYHMVNVRSHDELVNLFLRCDSILASVAVDLDVPVINVNEEIEGDERYFTDHVHTTPEGSRLIADYYIDFLKALIADQARVIQE